MIKRRQFIKVSAAAGAAALIKPAIWEYAPGKRLKNFGFISGIIEKELKQDWKSALKQASSFGYTEFETGSYSGDSPEEFLRFCSEINLLPVAGFINFNGNDEEVRKNIDLIHSLKMKLGVTYWPWYTGGPFTPDDCKRSAERLNYLGNLCHKNGVTFCWHNHNKEFIPITEGMPFDYLMNNTDKDFVNCELDIYWVKKGGADPLDMLEKYRGRYTILHIKDMAPGAEQDFECPGSGIIDFVPILREAESQGIKHFMVERDNVKDGIGCLRSSARYLRNLTF